MTTEHRQLEDFLEEFEQLLEKYCTKDWFYKFDIEDGVGIYLSIPKFKKGVRNDHR